MLYKWLLWASIMTILLGGIAYMWLMALVQEPIVISQWFVNSFNASKYFKGGGLASSLKGIAMNFENESRDFCLWERKK